MMRSFFRGDTASENAIANIQTAVQTLRQELVRTNETVQEFLGIAQQQRQVKTEHLQRMFRDELDRLREEVQS